MSTPPNALAQRIANEMGWTPDGVEPFVELAAVTEAEWQQNPEECIRRVRAAMEENDWEG